MQARLSSGDTKLLWIGGVVGLLLVSASAFLSTRIQRDDTGLPSSYSGNNTGALGAYLLLQELKFPVERWHGRPEDLPDATNRVLILAEPSVTGSASDRAALLAFVAAGGRVLYCGASLETFFPLSATAQQFLPLPSSYQATTPSSLTRAARSIQLEPRSQWTGKPADNAVAVTTTTLPLYGPEDRPVVTVNSLGDGEVIWWAGASPLTNTGIRKQDNLRLFLNAVSNPDGSPKRILWDEYFHGDQGDLSSYIAKTPVPWALWQIGIVAVVGIFAFSRRSGPIVAPALRSRLSPLEFVETMGDLYQRAGAASVAVEIPYLRLRRQLTRRLGLDAATPDPALAHQAALRLQMEEHGLRAALEQARTAAAAPHPDPKQSLSLVQALARYSRQVSAPRMMPIQTASQENNT